MCLTTIRYNNILPFSKYRIMTNTDKALLALVSAGIGHGTLQQIPKNVDWVRLFELSEKHGMSAICVDGFQYIIDRTSSLNSAKEPPISLKLKWIGRTFQIEQQYKTYLEANKALAKWYGEHNYPMMLLKGYGLSLNYPKPNHRPCGDIDIYLFGKWKEADSLISKKLGITVDNSHHHHSCFLFPYRETLESVGGAQRCVYFSVENHYDFINIHSHWSNKRIEKRFKDLARITEEEVLPNVFLPEPNLNALFVARHCAIHFASGELIIKQILDWALLIKASYEKIDWEVFWADCEIMGMKNFVLAIIDIAVNFFGFDLKIFNVPSSLQFNSMISKRILDDMLRPDFDSERPRGLLYLNWMVHRWWKHRWKHKLVYTDSLWSTFLMQLCSHLQKPASFGGK